MATTTSEILKTSATSKPVSVAGAIAAILRDGRRAEVHAIGPGAVNQAVKAIAVARGYTATQGIELVCIPSFIDLETDSGEHATGLRLVVEAR